MRRTLSAIVCSTVVSAFITPRCMPDRRGRTMYMSSLGRLNEAPGSEPANMNMRGMIQKVSVEALRDFQVERARLLDARSDKQSEREPVQETMKSFNIAYGRPVIPFYRTTLYELVQTGRLAVSDAAFSYTHFFAYGYQFAFETVFKGYPVQNEWIPLFEAAARSNGLDPDKIRKDSATLQEYMTSGKSEADFLRSLDQPGDHPIEQEISRIKNAKAFLPEKYFSFGLCKFIEALGVEVNWDSIKVWCEKLGLDETRTQLDWDLLERSMRKLGDLETLMKQVEIREKKKMAERLEERAKKAAEQAAAFGPTSSASEAPREAEPEKKEKKPVTA